MKAPVFVVAALLLSGCNNMIQQRRADDYETSQLFPDGKVLQHAPPGTVARDAAPQPRPAMSLALVERGRERFNIYCTPCHGYSGDGDGRIVSRGFPHPPSYYSQRLRAASDAHLVDVIGNGYGVMYPYGDRVAPADRWAIAAYIRALQRTRLTDRPNAG